MGEVPSLAAMEVARVIVLKRATVLPRRRPPEGHWGLKT